MSEIIGRVHLERMNNLIIQSDQMRTGASRYYSSSSAGYSRSQSWNAAGSMIFSLDDFSSERKSEFSRSQNGALANTNRIPTKEADDTDSTKETSGSPRPNADGMKNLMEQMSASSGIKRTMISDAISSLHQLRQQSLNYLLNMLFGRKNRMSQPAAAGNNGSQTEAFSEMVSDGKAYGAGGSYYSFFYYSEQETTCFDAQGMAVTADGREIPFSISLEMSRSFTQAAEHAIDFGLPRLCDPLVINLSGGAADVSDQKFFFDLDADGEQEEISSLGSGSGYLALDKNGDGEINDGSELFGTKSGNGFADLAAYDADGNGWIDEADEIFSRLKIWTKDENGNDKLLSLADAGVGAIHLGYEDTNFSLNRLEDNSTNAVIRKTGIFLYENGQSSTVQQLDLAT